VAAVAAAAVAVRGADSTWSAVDDALRDGVVNGAYPGVVGSVVHARRGVLFQTEHGRHTYASTSPKMSASETVFDLASVSKVMATTTAIMILIDRSVLTLDARIVDVLGEAFGANGKHNITVRNCLLHNAGFRADPDPFWSTPEFACPETAKPQPRLTTSCLPKIWKSLLAQPLPHAPIGSTYVYSDLSMITLAFVIGAVAQPPVPHVRRRAELPPPDVLLHRFERFVDEHVFAPLREHGEHTPRYLPPPALYDACAPTVNDTTYRHRVVQGQVQDPNTFAMGGVSGHAGLFARLLPLTRFVGSLLRAAIGVEPFDFVAKPATVAKFTKLYNGTQSSRALGWNTNDPDAPDRGWSQACGELSPSTFMHLGYTGTMVCADPVRQVALVLLSNRVWPFANNTKVSDVRRAVATAVARAVDAGA